MAECTMACRGALLTALIALAACAAPMHQKPDHPADGAGASAAATTQPEPAASPERDPLVFRDDERNDAATPAPDVPPPTLWERIVGRYAFAPCADPPPLVRRWARIYAQSPKRHADALAHAAPWIGYVADELERRNLPSDYVWLPFVESRYQAFRSSGDRPAGAWQLMPTTARGHGIRIGPDYDGRLDFIAATDAALDLLEHLATTFDRNWPLVTMAYNAGEYRIKGAIERARRSGQSTAPEQLGVSPITHEHLAKLRALACIVAAPDAVSMTLPAIDPDAQLVPVTVPAAMPTAQVARLSGATVTTWQTWNPAWRQGRVDAQAQTLVPVHLADAAIAALNAATPEPISITAPPPNPVPSGSVHIVRAGDSPWHIARRYRVSLAALLAANGLNARSVLRPGQRLRIP